jgi:hypothetical protein
MGTQRLFIKNPQFAGRIGNMAQSGGDFVFGPGALPCGILLQPFGANEYARPSMYLCVKNAARGRS